jgi:hypothetical protein
MQVVDLDGNISSWHITGNTSKANNINKSSLHLLARDILKKIYPTMPILEEVTVNIKRSEFVYLDFYIPMIKTCLEIHGEQHYKFVPFYHNNMMSFLKAQKRDRDKKQWCELNNINYIELPYDKTEQWVEIISNAKNV